MAKKKQRSRTNPVDLPYDIVLQVCSWLPTTTLSPFIHHLHDHHPLKQSLRNPSFLDKHALNITTTANNREDMQLMITPSFGSDNVSRLSFPSLVAASQEPPPPPLELKPLFHDSFKPIAKFRNAYVIGSCNGLVFLCLKFSQLPADAPNTGCSCCIYFHYAREIHNLLLWNPFTGEHYALPNPKKLLLSGKICDRSWNPQSTKWGFWYDQSSGSFKVVMAEGKVTEFYDLSTDSWDVYETNDWDGSKGDWDRLENEVAQRGQLSNGALHWVIAQLDIVALDLATKAYRHVSLPYVTHPCKWELGVLEGRLIISEYQDSLLSEVSIWSMEDEGSSSWTKLFTFSLPSLDVRVRAPPLWVTKDGKFLFQVRGRLALWHVDRQVFTYFQVAGYNDYQRCLVHVDTLASPKPRNIVNSP